ncbi:PA14 domain-containing protein [Herbivorax sp. ANBcel31]|uniref:PA14 domain-containing protein n=1 Tax=Herbivorax sp. ANBcel31 TaxID=3069754 RepID=UPI0027B5AD4A|nr:PA14 domain-containing protein [Herbivorax sp. ANBcel31]MDQ2086385.1 PA14 domain-containing protein [Herbivorax sp. ANBcel31]
MRFRGLIMDIGQHTVTVLTKDNEFYKLKRRPAMFKTQEVEFRKSDIINVAYYIKRLSTVAACLLLILTGMMFSDNIPVWNTGDSDVFGYVSLDVNPSVEFKIDEEQKILNVLSLSLTDDSEKEISLEGMKVTEGLYKVMEHYNEINVLSDVEENYVLLAGAINNKNKTFEEEIVKSLKDSKNRIEIEFERINMVVAKSSSEHRELATKNDISMGKYTIFTEINEHKEDISIEEYKNMSLKDIIEEYMEISKNHLDQSDMSESASDVEVEPENTPESTPENTPESTPENTPESTPENTPENTTENTSNTPKSTPENVPDNTPESTPEPTPESTPEVELDSTPTPSPAATPSATPEPTPNIMPTPERTARPTPTERPQSTPRITPTPRPIIKPDETVSPLPTPQITPAPIDEQSEGKGLRGEYYSNTDFTNLAGVRIDSEIDFDWSTTSPRPDLGSSYSVRWEGQIKPENSDMYTFHINRSSGVRLWVNGMMVINEWSGNMWTKESIGHVFLESGQKHDIKLEYYKNNSYGSIRLEWSSMRLPKEIVPQSVLFPSEKTSNPAEILEGNGDGLKGEYYNNMDLTDLEVKVVDSVIDFNWGLTPPHKTMINDGEFSVRWTGQIEPVHSEEHTFYVTRDNGARLWIDGELVIDEWNDMWNVTNKGEIHLEAGKKYDIKLEYYKNMGNGIMRLEWSSPSMSRDIVPSSRLYSE